MSKWVRYGVLLLFWGATFALVAAAVHYKKKMAVLGQEEQAGGAAGQETASDPAAATAATAGAAEKGGQEDGQSAAAAADRSAALFDQPASIDPEEFNALLEEVKTAKSDYTRRLAALDQRERDLLRREEELNHRQNEVMDLADRLADGTLAATAAAGATSDAAASTTLDPQGVAELAQFYTQIKDPSLVRDALLAMEPQQAAALLMAMDKRAGVAVLSSFPLEAFQEISAIILANQSAGN